MRIAVIADTHNHMPDTLRTALAGADEIWHLGDIGQRELLVGLQSIGPKVFAIRGNCDTPQLAPDSLTLERCGLRFYLVHEPPVSVPSGTDIALHGHTHVPRDETVRGVRFLSPGTVAKPNRGAPVSFAWLDIAAGRPADWTVVPIP
jgi:putative phosphoesterase